MRTVIVREAKTYLSRLLELAAAGEEIIIAKASEPTARLMPLEALKTLRNLGVFGGTLGVPEDFDAPLPDEALAQFYAEPPEAAAGKASSDSR